MGTRIVLARHGESLWNVEERYQGQADSGLTRRGRDQAAQLASWLIDAVGTVNLVLTSDSDRAQHTAAPYLARTGRPATLDPRLREVDTGSWTGRTFTEMAAAFPALVQAAARGEDVRRGDGETFAEVRVRVEAALADACTTVASGPGDGGHRPTVCVFTHGGPIRVATAAVIGMRAPGHQLLAPPTNCSVTVLEVPPPRLRETGQIVQYNAQIVPADRPSRAE